MSRVSTVKTAPKRCAKCGKNTECRIISPKYCIPCYKAYTKAWREKHPEYHSKKHKEYRTNPEFVERERTRRKERNEKNRPKYLLQKHKYNTSEVGRKAKNAQVHRRRALKRGNGGSHTAAEWEQLCTQYDNICLCCKEKKPLTKDHIRPIAKGGTDNIDNLQPLCLPCNLAKGTEHIDYRIKVQ